MGHKSQKGLVAITNYKERLRLRWRYVGIRYSINLSAFNKINLLEAKRVALSIEQDMVTDNFDYSLIRYNGKRIDTGSKGRTFVQLFESWVKNYKQMDCELHTNYNAVRNMIRKWDRVDPSNIVRKLNAEKFCGATYNRRLTMLKLFGTWLVDNQVWKTNPLITVSRKKHKKLLQPKRKPFSLEEIQLILKAFQENTFCPKSSAYKHSYYYPFMYFLFKTGVRNAEAIGLRCGSLDFTNNVIKIHEVLARGLSGTSSVKRILKETKNGKIRHLPFTEDLKHVLEPLIKNRNPDELVFKSPTGLSIDDHNFQNRIFKKVLHSLGIEERVLYACRHTFGSRCIDEGVSPVMTAFLMGNNPETALRNYTHQLNIPNNLPGI